MLHHFCSSISILHSSVNCFAFKMKQYGRAKFIALEFTLANFLRTLFYLFVFHYFLSTKCFSLGVAETKHNHWSNKIAMKFSPNELSFLTDLYLVPVFINCLWIQTKSLSNSCVYFYKNFCPYLGIRVLLHVLAI